MCKSLGNEVYECNGTCATGGSIWGTGLYTSDSDVFKAAKHMGIVPCKFKKVLVQGCGAYIGTTLNGITTSNYGNYGGSYFLIKIEGNYSSQEAKKDIKEAIRDELREHIRMKQEIKQQIRVLREELKGELQKSKTSDQGRKQIVKDVKDIISQQMREVFARQEQRLRQEKGLIKQVVKEELLLHNKSMMKYIGKDYIMCVLCGEHQRSRVVLPCSHFHFCEKCATQARQKGKCPSCQNIIMGDFKVLI